jgi:hypothetical protein
MVKDLLPFDLLFFSPLATAQDYQHVVNHCYTKTILISLPET